MYDFNGKKVMVAGMAASGFSAARLLLKLGAAVTLYDRNELPDEKLGELKDSCECCFTDDPSYIIDSMDALVLSPGIPTRLPFIKKAYEAGKYVIAEIELGYQASKAEFICISGTNGKTTTTALTGEIFGNAKKRTFVLGNIGTPICEKALETREGDYVVAETAALQLETADTLKPKACALLNLTEDHMDRFLTMDYYAECKMKMFARQDKSDFAIFNYDDELVRSKASGVGGTVLFFSRKQRVDGAYAINGRVYFEHDGVCTEICGTEDIRIPGAHNLENALAATALAACCGIDAETIAYTLKTFEGVEHRIEFVRSFGGVDFINDSKGTNPDSTIKAVETMKKPTVLILGGFDKHSDFAPLFAAFTPNIKGAVILGQTRDKIAAAADAAGFKNYVLEDGFKETIYKAYEMAGEGGVVLLSPACASWGMFKNYEERGRIFKDIVNDMR